MLSWVLLEEVVEVVEEVQLLDSTLVEFLEDVEDVADALLVLVELLEDVAELVGVLGALLVLDVGLIVTRVTLEREVEELEGELSVEELGKLEVEEVEEFKGLELGVEVISYAPTPATATITTAANAIAAGLIAFLLLNTCGYPGPVYLTA